MQSHSVHGTNPTAAERNPPIIDDDGTYGEDAAHRDFVEFDTKNSDTILQSVDELRHSHFFLLPRQCAVDLHRIQYTHWRGMRTETPPKRQRATILYAKAKTCGGSCQLGDSHDL
jgi:hypothetical protein